MWGGILEASLAGRTLGKLVVLCRVDVGKLMLRDGVEKLVLSRAGWTLGKLVVLCRVDVGKLM